MEKTLIITCPRCGTRLRASSEWVGQTRVCPECHHDVVIDFPVSTVREKFSQIEVERDKDRAILALLLCMSVIGSPIGLVMAICTDHSIRSRAGWEGHQWCVAAYYFFAASTSFTLYVCLFWLWLHVI